MTYSLNQKRNILINFGLPNRRSEFTIVISDIKYFLYRTNLFFPYVLGSKSLLRCSYVGGCVMSDVKVVGIFVIYAKSGTSGMCRGILTPTVDMIRFNIRL